MKSHDHEHINTNPLADSAGVPWEGRSFEQNPFSDDDGSARPELILAIAEFQMSGDASKVIAEVAKSRLLIPLLADLGESGQGAHGQTVDKSADLSIVTVKTPDGETGLPVFSSVTAMSAWNTKARPVPSDAVRVALAAVVLRTTGRPASPLPAAVGAARLCQARRQERAPAVAGSGGRGPRR